MRYYTSVFILAFIIFVTANFPLSSYGANKTDSLNLNHDTTVLHKGRLTGILVVQSSLYVASLTGLYFAWYSGYQQSSFHFFNDDNEWQQMG